MGVNNSHIFQEILLIVSDCLISRMRALHGDLHSSTAGQEIGHILWNSKVVTVLIGVGHSITETNDFASHS